MKIYVVGLGYYPGRRANDLVELFEVLDADIDTNKPEEDLLEEAAQIVEERKYWVYREESGGRCELAVEADGTMAAIISVASEVHPVWNGDRLVMWKARCPLCERILEIDPDDVGPSRHDPIEWTDPEIKAHCDECRNKKLSRFWGLG